MKKHVFVIIPVYNREKLITACLNSVICQTFSEWNAIVVDDGSTDDTGRIVDEYAKKDSRIFVIHQENIGIAGARNRGLDEAFDRIGDNKSDEYIGFLDSDDILEADALSQAVNIAMKHNADIVQWQASDFISNELQPENVSNRVEETNGIEGKTETVEIVTDSKGALEILLDTKGKGADNRFHLLWNNCRCVWTKLCAAHIYESVRCPRDKSYEDDFIVDELFMNADKIVFINDNLTNYRCHDSNFLKTTKLKDVLDHTECERNRFIHVTSFEDNNLIGLAFHNALMSSANSYGVSVREKCAQKSIWKNLASITEGYEECFGILDRVIFEGFKIAPRVMNLIYSIYRKAK